ncbi:MAG: hypothetical protein K2G87_07195 [Oscillospiraceae bacterium]|nr:hypothetical protein [Oscillospiraceae bacterium]
MERLTDEITEKSKLIDKLQSEAAEQLSQKSRKLFRKCAEKRNKRIGTYIREIAVGGIIKIYDLKQLDHWVMSFNRIGNEINPITEIVNSTRTVTRKDIEDLGKSIEYLKIVMENYLLPLKFDYFNNE